VQYRVTYINSILEDKLELAQKLHSATQGRMSLEVAFLCIDQLQTNGSFRITDHHLGDAPNSTIREFNRKGFSVASEAHISTEQGDPEMYVLTSQITSNEIATHGRTFVSNFIYDEIYDLFGSRPDIVNNIIEEDFIAVEKDLFNFYVFNEIKKSSSFDIDLGEEPDTNFLISTDDPRIIIEDFTDDFDWMAMNLKYIFDMEAGGLNFSQAKKIAEKIFNDGYYEIYGNFMTDEMASGLRFLGFKVETILESLDSQKNTSTNFTERDVEENFTDDHLDFVENELNDAIKTLVDYNYYDVINDLSSALNKLKTRRNEETKKSKDEENLFKI